MIENLTYISDTVPAVNLTTKMYLVFNPQAPLSFASRITKIDYRAHKVVVWTKSYAVRSFHPSIGIQVRRPNKGI